MNPKSRQVTPMPKNETGAAWAQEMRTHFEEHGFYRSQDLQRVLGDPRAHSEVRRARDPLSNFVVDEDTPER